MTHHLLGEGTCLSRRRFLQGTLSGVVGVAAWQGWPRLHTAMAQKQESSGQMTWAVHVTIAPTWFDPAETPGVITPYMFMYAMHDALVKPMPGNPMAPSLATRWSESADGLTYDFELRQGVKFHNGDPFTAEDVKFSFERYKGTGSTRAEKKGQSRRGRQSSSGAFPVARALAGFSHLLWLTSHRGRMDCAEEIHRAHRHRQVQGAAHRPRSL